MLVREAEVKLYVKLKALLYSWGKWTSFPNKLRKVKRSLFRVRRLCYKCKLSCFKLFLKLQFLTKRLNHKRKKQYSFSLTLQTYLKKPNLCKWVVVGHHTMFQIKFGTELMFFLKDTMASLAKKGR